MSFFFHNSTCDSIDGESDTLTVDAEKHVKQKGITYHLDGCAVVRQSSHSNDHLSSFGQELLYFIAIVAVVVGSSTACVDWIWKGDGGSKIAIQNER